MKTKNAEKNNSSNRRHRQRRLARAPWFCDVGQPDTTPLPGNVAWEHPRVELACDELHKAATAFANERAKSPKDSSFQAWSDVCNRLENAAITFGNMVREYTVA